MKKHFGTVSCEDLREVCIANGWFTCGDCSQYDKLFELNSEECSLEELAFCIWLCSVDVSRDEVLNQLRKLA